GYDFYLGLFSLHSPDIAKDFGQAIILIALPVNLGSGISLAEIAAPHPATDDRTVKKPPFMLCISALRVCKISLSSRALQNSAPSPQISYNTEMNDKLQ
ncbi:MAG: hypothetical protein H6Q38_529, partial [Chloroflexi bacterium]|nr:hypothetical protein [Chloroflexota bacterium]